MGERRTVTRVRMLKSGNILLGSRKVPCTVRNLSEIGACLMVQTTYGIPAAFQFRGPSGELQACKVVWRNDTKLGVHFC